MFLQTFSLASVSNHLRVAAHDPVLMITEPVFHTVLSQKKCNSSLFLPCNTTYTLQLAGLLRHPVSKHGAVGVFSALCLQPGVKRRTLFKSSATLYSLQSGGGTQGKQPLVAGAGIKAEHQADTIYTT